MSEEQQTLFKNACVLQTDLLFFTCRYQGMGVISARRVSFGEILLEVYGVEMIMPLEINSEPLSLQTDKSPWILVPGRGFSSA